jgi:hypothetical protein
MKTHELKIWPEQFAAVKAGHKLSETRFNDRNFAVGDILWLREYDPALSAYTGRTRGRVVTHVAGTVGLLPNYVVLSMKDPMTANEGTK